MKELESAKDLFGKVIKRGDTVIYLCHDKNSINHGVITDIIEDPLNYILIKVKSHALSSRQKHHDIDFVTQASIVKYDL
jgi:hypothetical protein